MLVGATHCGSAGAEGRWRLPLRTGFCGDGDLRGMWIGAHGADSEDRDEDLGQGLRKGEVGLHNNDVVPIRKKSRSTFYRYSSLT